MILLLVLALAVAARRFLQQSGTSLRPAPQTSMAACNGQQGCFTGTVTKVVDGDTLDVGNVRIRLVLVDAPELNTREGPGATEHLRELCPEGSPARVLEDRLQPRDQYGRMLGLVWCGSGPMPESSGWSSCPPLSKCPPV